MTPDAELTTAFFITSILVASGLAYSIGYGFGEKDERIKNLEEQAKKRERQ